MNILKGLGRVAIISLFLGSTLTGHFIVLILIFMERSHRIQVPFLHDTLNQEQIHVLVKWLLYTICICIFHLGEFFITAIYNPSSISASSFLINHSTAYTAAYLVCANFYFIVLSDVMNCNNRFSL